MASRSRGDDLTMRGPGEFLGARQSGVPLLRFADLQRDAELVEQARAAATELLVENPDIARQHVQRWYAASNEFLDCMRLHRMTLTELRYVVAVARERHFGRAADACFVSQPTLSVAIKKLEDELGTQIFERRTNDVTMTPAGERIVGQAQRTLDEAGRIKEIARQGKDPLSGRFGSA